MKKIFILLPLLFSSLLVSAEDKMMLTVLDFRTEGVSESEMNSMVSLLSSALFKTGKYTVIDSAERNSILSEIEFSMSACTTDECMIEIGKLLSAELIVTGNIGRLGTKYVISARIIETETSRTMNTVDGIYESMDDLVGNITPLAFNLAEVEYAPPEEYLQPRRNIFAEMDKKLLGGGIGILAGAGLFIASYFLNDYAENSENLTDYDSYVLAKRFAQGMFFGSVAGIGVGSVFVVMSF